MTEIVKASLENGIHKKSKSKLKSYHPATISLQKGEFQMITFHRATLLKTYKEILC